MVCTSEVEPGRVNLCLIVQGIQKMQIPFLDRLLASLDVNVNGFAICEVQRGFSLNLPGMKAPIAHYVLRGSGSLRMESGTELVFRQHDFFVVPSGRSQRIEVAADTAVEERGADQCVALVDGMLRMSASSGAAADVVTTCGMIEATYAGTLGLFDGLSEPLLVHLASGTPLRRAIEDLLAELTDPKLGTHTITEALLKQCLVLLVRELAEDPGRVQSLFGAVNPGLLRPVLAVAEHPAQEFSLEALAKMAGMSRSGFAAQFSATFGQPPIDFLRSIRLRRAARLLERTDLPVSMIAKSIGYGSRTYFSRAFREEFGIDPRGYRARHRRVPI